MAMSQSVRLEWPYVLPVSTSAATAVSHQFDGNFSLPVVVMPLIFASVAIGGSERFWNMFYNGSRTQWLRIWLSGCGIARLGSLHSVLGLHIVAGDAAHAHWNFSHLHSCLLYQCTRRSCCRLWCRFEMMAVYLPLQIRVVPGRRCP